MNPYAVLEVEPGASVEDIGAAFRHLGRKYHPDRNPGDRAAEARFKELSEAYAVLSDPAKRAAYDRGEAVDVDLVDADAGDLFARMFEGGAEFFKPAGVKKDGAKIVSGLAAFVRVAGLEGAVLRGVRETAQAAMGADLGGEAKPRKRKTR